MRPEACGAKRRCSALSWGEAPLAEQNPLPLPCTNRFQVEAASLVRGSVSDRTGIMRWGADLCGSRHRRNAREGPLRGRGHWR